MSNTEATVNLQILTPTGFQLFDGVKRYWHDQSVVFTFDDGTELNTANEHKFVVGETVTFAKDVQVGDDIGKVVKHKRNKKSGDWFYDPVNVANGSIFLHDDMFVSHNTFIGTGNTLINAETLLRLKAHDPISRDNAVRIHKKPVKGHNYLMTVDVAKGRGVDYSTFNIIDISVDPFEQVCVFQDNMISPLLFPDIIYKYAKMYNNAYVVIESNDQGMVVCNGLYYDLQYENMHVESLLKANSLGVTMNKKVKRIGCSHAKDLIERGKLKIIDAETIIEASTFVHKGQSYEASDGNHDDLMMNLVMFGWFAATDMFQNMTDIKLKSMLYEETVRKAEDDLVPFGEIDDGLPKEEVFDFGQKGVWQVVGSEDF